jgi:tetratricopeptide (TPR) repeat protein
LSVEERDAGLLALRSILREEVIRSRSADTSIMLSVGEDSGGIDELLLRLALVQVLLEGRREAEALEEAKKALAFQEAVIKDSNKHSTAAAVNFLLSRCLLRAGERADGLSTLEKIERSPPSTSESPEWIHALWQWGHKETQRFLLAHRSSEKYRVAALDAYARGSCQDAAALFGRSLELLKAGCSDDKRGKAATLADRAGCLRRDRQLDKAVEDLDAALRLFPRFKRALFRRAVCLLEAGKATDAVNGFKDLYRADRNWPNLSEWLVRAYSLQKRQSKGYQSKEGIQYEDPAADGIGKDNGNMEFGSNDAYILAREVDHYAVLGVSTDATEKQLKTAYRMRSLQFHPDRNRQAGNTAAFQRIAEAYQVLSDPDKRRAYDEGVDIKVKRGRKDEDDDSEDEEEEHKTTMREEVEREFYPERYHFWPFGTVTYI